MREDRYTTSVYADLSLALSASEFFCALLNLHYFHWSINLSSVDGFYQITSSCGGNRLSYANCFPLD